MSRRTYTTRCRLRGLEVRYASGARDLVPWTLFTSSDQFACVPSEFARWRYPALPARLCVGYGSMTPTRLIRRATIRSLIDGSHRAFWSCERRDSMIGAFLIVAGGIAVPLLGLFRLSLDAQTTPEVRLDPVLMNMVRILWGVTALFCIAGVAWLIVGIRRLRRPHLVGLETSSAGVTEFLSDGTTAHRTWPDFLHRRRRLSRSQTCQPPDLRTVLAAARVLHVKRPRRYSPILKIRMALVVAPLFWTAMNSLALFLYLSPPDPARHERPLPFAAFLGVVVFWTALILGPLIAEFIINRRPSFRRQLKWAFGFPPRAANRRRRSA